MMSAVGRKIKLGCWWIDDTFNDDLFPQRCDFDHGLLKLTRSTRQHPFLTNLKAIAPKPWARTYQYQCLCSVIHLTSQTSFLVWYFLRRKLHHQSNDTSLPVGTSSPSTWTVVQVSLSLFNALEKKEIVSCQAFCLHHTIDRELSDDRLSSPPTLMRL